MSNAARIQLPASPAPAGDAAGAHHRVQKTRVFLVTQDEALWPLIGPGLESEYTLKQVDTTDELLEATSAGQAAVIIWDARDCADRAAGLSLLQRQSDRFAIIVLDFGANTEAWRLPAQQRQIESLVAVPFKAAQLTTAVASAREELGNHQARAAEVSESTPDLDPVRPLWQRRGVQIGAAVVLVCSVGFLVFHKSAPPVAIAPVAVTAPAVAPAADATAGAPANSVPDVTPSTATDEQVDTLLEKARQAMTDRHFIDPANGNALTFYQDVLVFDPGNGEARQGLQRLAQILFARVQSDLDEQKIDLALQALETARTINPDDARLLDLDARIVTLRAELGPAQIQAALNAKNFDRAAQLLDDAARAKSLSPAKLSQLRDELRQHREASDADRLVKLIDTRLQQDHLLEPHNDSAAFYLEQARQAGVSAAELQQQSQEFIKKLLLAARAALDQHHLSDAEREINEARSENAAPALIAGLQHDLAAARDQQAHDKAVAAQLLDSAQTRLAQGKILEPDGDSAVFYVIQLRSADPKNDAVHAISTAVQAEVVTRARAVLESGDAAKAASLASIAGQLGGSADLDSLNDKIAQEQLKQKQNQPAPGIPTVAGASLVAKKPLRPTYPLTALSRGIEGWVDLKFTVTREGKVVDVAVVDSAPKSVFDGAATAAASHVRYEPFVKDGHAIDVKTEIRVVFKMGK
ncbi:MAG: energy transducer TonB [Steroidobacteraceae bacterium]